MTKNPFIIQKDYCFYLNTRLDKFDLSRLKKSGKDVFSSNKTLNIKKEIAKNSIKKLKISVKKALGIKTNSQEKDL